MRNLEEIIQVPGIDVIFVGPYDLSQSLGKPGKVKDPEIIECIRKSVEVVNKHGLVCGSFAADEEYLDMLLALGVQYITYSVDSAMVVDIYKEAYDTFKGKVGRV